MDTNLLNQISQYGFPIVISLYLLMRMENKIESLTNAINMLNFNIEAMTGNSKSNIAQYKKID